MEEFKNCPPGLDGGEESDNTDSDFQDCEDTPVDQDIQSTADYAYMERLKRLRSPTVIVDKFLFVGDRLQAMDMKTLKMYAITHVLNVNNTCRFVGGSYKYKIRHVPLSDYGDDDISTIKSSKLVKCLDFMDTAKQEKGRILVHCSKGVNRSPTIAIAYLMVREKWSLERAYKHVTGARTQALPHEKYFDQLQLLEKQILGKISYTREQAGPSLQQILRDLRSEWKEEADLDKQEQSNC